jgi:HTH-type transcriptional regulator/antitoxin HigA
MPALDQLDFKGLYPLRVIKNEKSYKEALKSMETVFDATEGYLAEYAETLTILIEHYERERFPIKESSAIDVVRFLMDQNGLKQKDLIGILGGKSSVSEILHEKRLLNLQHIRALSAKFNVNPATFI